MNDAIGDVARSAAVRLTPELAQPRLAADVEAQLQPDEDRRAAQQYLDPISLGGLIVSVATLAWTVYSDMKAKKVQPSPEVLARTVRVRLHDTGARDLPSPTERDRIIEVIVEETVKQADR